MLFIFFQNMTIIITFIFLYNKLKNFLVHRKASEELEFFTTYALTTTLTLATMVNRFAYLGYSFDLRSVPLFFISYKKGWKLGLLSGILPALYRSRISSIGIMEGIIYEILLPVLIGTLFGKSQNLYKKFSNIKMNISKILKDFIIFIILKQILLGFALEVPFRAWWEVSISVAIFSTLTLLSVSIIIDDSDKQIYSEKNLRISEERYRKLVEILPDGVMIYKNGEIAFVNTAIIELAGLENNGEIINFSNKIISKEGDNNPFIDNNIIRMLIDRKIESGTENHKITLESGIEIDIEIRGISFESEGKIMVINVIRDITSIKKTQFLEEKIKHEQKVLAEIMEYDRLKTEFVANISHELRTPLNLLFSTVQLMEFEAKDKDNINLGQLNRRFKILKQNCSRMIKLANNLIDITKIDSGNFELNLQNCDIVRITEDITLSVADYIESKNIGLTFDTYVEEKIIQVDPNAIERIILNLLSNAVKFSKPNNQITVTIFDYEENIVISVKDQGQGIPNERLDIIFDRFRQVDKLLNRSHEGSGIGLSLVKSLVTMHGGEIFVKSIYGQGSEFIIKLPAETKMIHYEDDETEEFKNRYCESINIEFSDIYSS